MSDETDRTTDTTIDTDNTSTPKPLLTIHHVRRTLAALGLGDVSAAPTLIRSREEDH